MQDDERTTTTEESHTVRTFTASEAAAELGTDGKTLRRFLRQDSSFKNAGSGGRYEFTSADMPSLTEKFNAWHNRPKSSKSTGRPLIDDTPGLPHSIVRSRDPKDQARVKELSRQRVDRLEAALKAAGLHISQMREFGADRRAAVAADQLMTA